MQAHLERKAESKWLRESRGPRPGSHDDAASSVDRPRRRHGDVVGIVRRHSLHRLRVDDHAAQPLHLALNPNASFDVHRRWLARYLFRQCSSEETRLDAFEMNGLRKILRVSWTAKKTNEWVLNKAGVKRHRQSKKASILWSHREETRELPGERDNAMNNARGTQARKTTHGLDGQHQDVDRTLRGRVSQNDRKQR